ncbi:autotransporter outer membrane beta-barrel domain-containing protein [Endozoicomonas sp. 4G]|uniref:autotransporter outer membrane beta-barrel domain-containing protein n=1 Tax=Endozoicomonas sp. 4G TaxID=2872754 RepID=UPI002079175A|nr:autotransporter outer membrane beta-barrel domain-containing protein [Endozoicomonas sp. 4G]
MVGKPLKLSLVLVMLLAAAVLPGPVLAIDPALIVTGGTTLLGAGLGGLSYKFGQWLFSPDSGGEEKSAPVLVEPISFFNPGEDKPYELTLKLLEGYGGDGDGEGGGEARVHEKPDSESSDIPLSSKKPEKPEKSEKSEKPEKPEKQNDSVKSAQEKRVVIKVEKGAASRALQSMIDQPLPEAGKVLYHPTPSAQATLNATRHLEMASTQALFSQLSDLRQILDFYRNGQAFPVNHAALDQRTLNEGYQTFTETLHSDQGSQWHSFVQVYGSKSHYSSLPDLEGMNANSYGLNAGVFRQATENTIVGMMLGTRTTSAVFQQKLGSGSVESVHLGPFLSWQKGPWQFDGALTVATQQYDSRRYVDGRRLRAYRSGTEWNAYSALGYDIDMSHWLDALTVTPMVEFLYHHSESDRFREKGLPGETLAVGGQAFDQWLLRLGSDFVLLNEVGGKPSALKLSVGYQQQTVLSGNSRYTVNGAQQQGSLEHVAQEINDTGLYLSLGYHARMSEQSAMSINYMAIRSCRSSSNGLQLSYSRAF